MTSLRMNQFYKTKTCPWFFKGRCERGDACRFAHNDQEKRDLPDLSRTSFCPMLLKHGVCHDHHCRFAHNVDQLRATDAMYKTSLCFMFMKSCCEAGNSCRHAHGTHELRTPPVSNQEKRGSNELASARSKSSSFSAAVMIEQPTLKGSASHHQSKTNQQNYHGEASHTQQPLHTYNTANSHPGSCHWLNQNERGKQKTRQLKSSSALMNTTNTKYQQPLYQGHAVSMETFELPHDYSHHEVRSQPPLTKDFLQKPKLMHNNNFTMNQQHLAHSLPLTSSSTPHLQNTHMVHPSILNHINSSDGNGPRRNSQGQPARQDRYLFNQVQHPTNISLDFCSPRESGRTTPTTIASAATDGRAIMSDIHRSLSGDFKSLPSVTLGETTYNKNSTTVNRASQPRMSFDFQTGEAYDISATGMCHNQQKNPKSSSQYHSLSLIPRSNLTCMFTPDFDSIMNGSMSPMSTHYTHSQSALVGHKNPLPPISLYDFSTQYLGGQSPPQPQQQTISPRLLHPLSIPPPQNSSSVHNLSLVASINGAASLSPNTTAQCSPLRGSLTNNGQLNLHMSPCSNLLNPISVQSSFRPQSSCIQHSINQRSPTDEPSNRCTTQFYTRASTPLTSSSDHVTAPLGLFTPSSTIKQLSTPVNQIVPAPPILTQVSHFQRGDIPIHSANLWTYSQQPFERPHFVGSELSPNSPMAVTKSCPPDHLNEIGDGPAGSNQEKSDRGKSLSHTTELRSNIELFHVARPSPIESDPVSPKSAANVVMLQQGSGVIANSTPPTPLALVGPDIAAPGASLQHSHGNVGSFLPHLAPESETSHHQRMIQHAYEVYLPRIQVVSLMGCPQQGCIAPPPLRQNNASNMTSHSSTPMLEIQTARYPSTDQDNNNRGPLSMMSQSFAVPPILLNDSESPSPSLKSLGDHHICQGSKYLCPGQRTDRDDASFYQLENENTLLLEAQDTVSGTPRLSGSSCLSKSELSVEHQSCASSSNHSQLNYYDVTNTLLNSLVSSKCFMSPRVYPTNSEPSVRTSLMPSFAPPFAPSKPTSEHSVPPTILEESKSTSENDLERKDHFIKVGRRESTESESEEANYYLRTRSMEVCPSEDFELKTPFGRQSMRKTMGSQSCQHLTTEEIHEKLSHTNLLSGDLKKDNQDRHSVILRSQTFRFSEPLLYRQGENEVDSNHHLTAQRLNDSCMQCNHLTGRSMRVDIDHPVTALHDTNPNKTECCMVENSQDVGLARNIHHGNNHDDPIKSDFGEDPSVLTTNIDNATTENTHRNPQNFISAEGDTCHHHENRVGKLADYLELPTTHQLLNSEHFEHGSSQKSSVREVFTLTPTFSHSKVIPSIKPGWDSDRAETVKSESANDDCGSISTTAATTTTTSPTAGSTQVNRTIAAASSSQEDLSAITDRHRDERRNSVAPIISVSNAVDTNHIGDSNSVIRVASALLRNRFASNERVQWNPGSLPSGSVPLSSRRHTAFENQDEMMSQKARRHSLSRVCNLGSADVPNNCGKFMKIQPPSTGTLKGVLDQHVSDISPQIEDWNLSNEQQNQPPSTVQESSFLQRRLWDSSLSPPRQRFTGNAMAAGFSSPPPSLWLRGDAAAFATASPYFDHNLMEYGYGTSSSSSLSNLQNQRGPPVIAASLGSLFLDWPKGRSPATSKMSATAESHL